MSMCTVKQKQELAMYLFAHTYNSLELKKNPQYYLYVPLCIVGLIFLGGFVLTYFFFSSDLMIALSWLFAQKGHNLQFS